MTKLFKDLDQALVNATVETFETLFGERAEVVAPEALLEKTRLSSIVAFSGECSGFVALHFSAPMACKVASQLLGSPMTEIDDTVRDAVGEIANVLAGVLKKCLNPTRDFFRLSVPSVVDSDDRQALANARTSETEVGVVAGDYRFKLQLALQRAKIEARPGK